ncbi:sugar O-acetyltransferase [Cellulomonas cellasea]|nr:sugar O-acetyltransferase [Cellulomonas cellasea]
MTATTPGTDDTRSMRERMLAGDPYLADDPELAEANAAALDLMAAYNATTPRQGPLRRALLEQLLGAVGEGTEIRPPFFVDYGTQIRVGARCFANYGLVALDVATVTIGDDVQMGPNVQLLTPTHPVEPGPRRDKWEAAKPIVIGDNVWLGGGVVVLPGVTIGANTVVGAGSVVTRDLPANVVAVGNPARVVRTIDDDADTRVTTTGGRAGASSKAGASAAAGTSGR